MDGLYALKPYCYPIGQHRWFHPSLQAHLTKEPSLKQQKAWLETYGPKIRKSARDRRRRNDARRLSRGLPIIEEHFMAHETGEGRT
jgi:hypothetical protein